MGQTEGEKLLFQPRLDYKDMLPTAAFGGITFTFWAVAMVTTILRAYTRGVIIKNIGLDDYLSFLATILSLAVTLLAYYATRSYNNIYYPSLRAGKILFDPSDEQLTHEWDLGYRYDGIMEWVYNVALPLAKCSILAFYLRVSVLSTKRTRLALWVFMGLIAFHGLLNFSFSIAAYKPVSVVWAAVTYSLENPNKEEFRYEPDKIQLGNSVLQFVYDLIILAIPIPFLLRLKVMRNKKSIAPIGLIVIYVLSLISIVLSLIRMLQCIDFERADDDDVTITDPFYVFRARVFYLFWTVIEVTTVIIIANLPALYALWKRQAQGEKREPSAGTGGYFLFSRFAPKSFINASRHRTDGAPVDSSTTKHATDADMEKALDESSARLGNGHSTTTTMTKGGTQMYSSTDAKSGMEST